MFRSRGRGASYAPQHIALVLLIVAALVAGGEPAWAVDGDSVWNQSSGDGLTTPLYGFDGTNWLPLNTIPNGTIDDGFIADFSRNPLSVAQQTVTLDQDVTIGHLILGDLNGNGARRQRRCAASRRDDPFRTPQYRTR